ncbi:MAG: glutamine--fructose-6-phosphate transaminase (isomerizing), partial [Legionellaceae bacterium]|nr:glutamine--fructose-6-phosphate transaminase (isomerizing) [Legionellaceae bacterium]
MCGIVGAVSKKEVVATLLTGLQRLEYRGYDSAGIAVIEEGNRIKRIRMEGKVQALVTAVTEASLSGGTGIAHTRWATHGKPNEANAHPHISHEKVAIVHNGIIENYQALKEQLQRDGYTFFSETDTEIAAHLIHYHYEKEPNFLLAVQAAAAQMHGAFALAVLHADHPHTLVAVRRGSPLIVGFGQDAHFVASDPMALQSYAQAVLYLEEGDSVCLTEDTAKIFDNAGCPVERPKHVLSSEDRIVVDKGTFRHFMLKEMYEQPQVLANTLEGRLTSWSTLRSSFGDVSTALFEKVAGIHIIACGTSYHAGLIARYWLETLTGLPTQVEIASEYRYREVVVPPNTLFVAVSQSGETADTLAALSKAKELGYLGYFAICNVPTSSLVRLSDGVFLTRAGAEIGVASTKAFITQLAAFLMLATALCPNEDQANEVLAALRMLPEATKSILALAPTLEALAARLMHAPHILFLGRGSYYPVALEGALKLKEISYIHAEAYPAGELKHGPLALVDKQMPVIALAPVDHLFDKMQSNVQEVCAR